MRKQFVLAILLLAVIVFSTGCAGFWDQPGMTAQEVHREHLRILRVNNQQMLRDIDRLLGFDQPSRLTEMKLP